MIYRPKVSYFLSGQNGGLTESAAEGRGEGPSIRVTRSAAAGDWNAWPDADFVQPIAHQFPFIPHQAATPPFHTR